MEAWLCSSDGMLFVSMVTTPAAQLSVLHMKMWSSALRDPGCEACSVPCSQTRMGLLFWRFIPKQRGGGGGIYSFSLKLVPVVVIIDFISAAQLFLHPVCIYALLHLDESGTCTPLKKKRKEKERSIWFRSLSLYKAGRGIPWLKTKRLWLITLWVWSCFYHHAWLSVQ